MSAQEAQPGNTRDQENPPRGDLPRGTRLGPWSLTNPIGHGGAADVYLARRADGAFQQNVAIKVLQRGTVAEAARFQSERQILARLAHPGIARLLDGGMLEDGRPYMAMEYVEGVPLTEYCETHRLDLEARLALFREVCDVVSFAHRNLVVHRDLKPRNILVTRDGRAKLLDFGVAKLLDSMTGLASSTGAHTTDVPAADKTSAPLTPSYAAPEQLTGQPITTATDVYALGVVLFEILTGRKPFQNAELPVAHAVRMVLQEPAPAPSRVARAVSSPGVTFRRLQGDLDAIVAKCLRKEPEHRYESVSRLERDIRRFLDHEPVAARAGARWYVVSRLLRKYRWGVAAAAGIVIALSGSLAVVSWQAHRIALERDIAQRAAAREQAFRYYVTRLFRASAADHDTEQTTAKQMLDRSAQRVLKEYRDDPLLAGMVVETLSDLYGALEDFEGQVPLLEGFLSQAAEEASPHSVAYARQQLANVELQRGNVPRAAELLPLALAFWETDARRHAAARLEGLTIRGRLQRAQGDLEAAIATYEAAIRERIAHSGENHPETASLYNSLAIAHMNANHFDDALDAYRRALAIQDALHRGDELDAQIMRGNMGMLAYRYGQVDEAEPLLRGAYTKQQALAGNSAAVAAAMGYYGAIRSVRGKHEEALDVLRASVSIATEFAGPASPVAIQNRLFLGEALHAAGRREAALETLMENLKLGRAQLGEQHLSILRTQLAQARIAVRSDDVASREAGRQALVTLVAAFRDQGKAGQLPLAQALVLLADALESRPGEADAPLQEALRIREALLWERSPDLAEVRARLARLRS